MAIVFHDGCGEGYQSEVDYSERWGTFGVIENTWILSSTVRSGALGVKSLSSNGSAGQLNYIIVADLTTIFVEFWFRATSNATEEVVLLRDSGTNTHFKITRSGSGSNMILTAFDANATQVGSTYDAGTVGNWVHVGVKLVTGAAGNVTVRYDDSVHLSAVSGDFLNGSNNFVRKVAFNTSNSFGTSTGYDDIVIQDSGGAFLGSAVHNVASFPTSAGDSTQWTPSAGANFQNVDEVDPNDDTDFNSSSTAGQLDLFQVTDLPSYTGVVKAVTVTGKMRKDSGGTEQAKLAVKTNSSVAYGSTVSLTNTYASYLKLWETNPVTAVAWTQADINSLQIGVEVV